MEQFLLGRVEVVPHSVSVESAVFRDIVFHYNIILMSGQGVMSIQRIDMVFSQTMDEHTSHYLQLSVGGVEKRTDKR